MQSTVSRKERGNGLAEDLIKKEEQLQQRLEKIKALEEEVKKKEKALKDKEKTKKQRIIKHNKLQAVFLVTCHIQVLKMVS